MLNERAKEILLSSAKKQEEIILKQRDALEKRQKDWRNDRLFNVNVGKMLGILCVIENFDFQKELPQFDWVYNYGI